MGNIITDDKVEIPTPTDRDGNYQWLVESFSKRSGTWQIPESEIHFIIKVQTDYDATLKRVNE